MRISSRRHYCEAVNSATVTPFLDIDLAHKDGYSVLMNAPEMGAKVVLAMVMMMVVVEVVVVVVVVVVIVVVVVVVVVVECHITFMNAQDTLLYQWIGQL